MSCLYSEAVVDKLTVFLILCQSQAEAHYKGSRHAKKLKSQENKTKANLSVTGESCGSSSSPAVPPASAIDNSCQHTGSFYLLNLSRLPFRRLPYFFYIIPQASLIYSSLFCFVPSVLFLSPELSCSLTDSSPHLKTLAPHLYSPSPSSSRAGSEPPPSSPPSALPAPAPVTSSLSPPPPPAHASSQDAALPVESEEEKAKKLLYCSLCKVAVNSLSQLEAHNAGKWELLNVCLTYNPSWQQQRPKLEKYSVRLLLKRDIWSLYRFKAQDHAGGPKRRRANQGLPSARSQTEERQHLRNQGVRPTEQNLPLPNLWRPRQLRDPAETGRAPAATFLHHSLFGYEFNNL